MYCFGVLKTNEECSYILLCDEPDIVRSEILNYDLRLVPVLEAPDDLIYVMCSTVDHAKVYLTNMFTNSVTVANITYKLLTFECASVLMSKRDAHIVPVSIDAVFKRGRKSCVMFSILANNVEEIAEYILKYFPTCLNNNFPAEGVLFRCELPISDFQRLCTLNSLYLLNPYDSVPTVLSVPKPLKLCTESLKYDFLDFIHNSLKTNSYPDLREFPNLDVYRTQMGLSYSEMVRELPELLKRKHTDSLQELNETLQLAFK